MAGQISHNPRPLLPLLHVLTYLLLLFIHKSIQNVLPSHLSCPGIHETDIGSRPQLKIGLVIQSNDLLQDSEGSAEELSGIIDSDPLYPKDYGLRYSRSSSIAQIAMAQIELINHNPSILPHHHVCLLIVFYLLDHPGAESTHTYLIFTRYEPAVVVNMIHDIALHNEHEHLLSNFYPLISIKQYENNQCVLPSLAVEAFTHTLQAIGAEDLCPHPYDTILEMIIGQRELLVSVRAFTKAMGWNRIGLLSDCQISRDALSKQWPTGDALICFSQNNPNNFEETFQVFADNEIFIYVFLGKLGSYYQFLRTAYDYGVVGRR